ncbi:Histone-lysine N-methyltransferase SMYD3 (SET and MYND domain-containing protein 3) (Zinc finger MYND domain-containing protein 1) [Durusdinium trenchii]|uniref:Histone-lysine N-methyltransferase SMYD3 (SET and MYND domain-containing protein 3) (Zinc finger MYND domain-containing protein 1) n=1 Tax=Durusdinium trenchii TaxID=1381693 RepID=A0ABP0IY19_9DINO
MVSEFAASLAVRASQRAAGLGLFTTQRHKAGSLLLAVPAGRCTSPALRELQAASRGSERYQLRQALSSEAALKDVALPEAMPIGQEHAFGALLSDPRQWRSVSAPRLLLADKVNVAILLRLFFTLAQLTRAPVSSAFSVHGLINHSCDPNVQRTFATAGKDEHWLLLRAAEDLESGEELMDSYFFPLVPLAERRHLLSLLDPKATFECRCVRCLNEALTDEASSWSALKAMVLQLAVLRGKRLASQAALPGIKDPFLLHPEARQVLLQLQVTHFVLLILQLGCWSFTSC